MVEDLMHFKIFIGICLLFIGFCFLARRIIRCFLSRGYTQNIIAILITLIAIVTFLFGLHASIISQFSREVDKSNEYYWLNPSNIFMFPIQQLVKYNFVDTIDNSLNYTQKENINYIFIVDKTLSNKIKKEDIWVMQVKDSLKQILKKENYKTSIDSLQDYSDILLLSEMSYLCANQNYKVRCTVFIYNGLKPEDTPEEATSNLFEKSKLNKRNKLNDKKFRGYSESNKFSINKLKKVSSSNSFEKMIVFKENILEKEKYYDFLESYEENISKIKENSSIIQPKKRKTDFVHVFKMINNEIILDTTCRNVIAIFSDFLHEEDNWELLEKKVKDIIEIEGKNKHIQLFALENKNATDKEKLDIARTISLIKNNRPYVFLYEFKQGGILNDLVEYTKKDIQIYTSSLAQIVREKPTDTINFCYPINYDKLVETNSAKIRFKNSGKYVLNIRTESSEDKILMKLKPTKGKSIILKNNQLDIKYIDSSKTYNVNIQASSLSKDIYLEISNQKGKGTILITFKELIPKTICYVLIFVHTLIVLLFCSCVIFFFLKSTYCLRKRYKIEYDANVIFIIILILPSLASGWLLYCCSKAVAQISFLVIWWLFVSFVISVLIILLYQEHKHFEEKCRECLKKN